MKTHLTPFQLFFLTFLYVFSGISLANADSVTALLLPLCAAVLWAVIGYRGATKKREAISAFLSAYMPKRETGIPLALFFFTAAAETVILAVRAGTVLHLEADFIPFPMVLFILAGIAVLGAKKGMTVLGRFAELSLFLLVPLVAVHLFGEGSLMKLTGHASGVALVFSVMPAPVFFLLSQTAVSGDEGITDGFRATGTAPKSRAGFLVKIVMAAAVFAVGLRAFLEMLSFGERDLLVYFLEYMSYAAKLSLLVSFLAHGVRNQSVKTAVWHVLLMISGAMLTLAIIQGAAFSPFLWITLLVSLNLTVSAMLGLFAVR